MEIFRLGFLVLSWVIFVSVYSTKAEVPAIFIFGDSTADVGTNNFLPKSQARADFPHNGIDFPHSRPTGRFSNGFNSADFLAKLMGLKRSPPPFFSVNVTSALKRSSFRGINFASGGSGLLDLTGQSPLRSLKFGKESNPNSAPLNTQKNVIPLVEQVQQFAEVYGNLLSVMGPQATQKFLSKSLFFISIGSNDIFSYYHSNSSTSSPEFLSSLALAYEKHLKNLLSFGAKKIGIISVPPIGCCPSQRVYNSTGGCLEELNGLAIDFYSKINDLMLSLSSECKDLKYSLGNTYEMTINVIEHPLLFNFTDVKTACCGTGTLNGEGICDPKANLCSNRDVHLFWDLFHPTQVASRLAAITLYGGEQRFVFPINFSQLAYA